MRPDLAPGHVARIKELVREGFYDGIVFHRVIDGFMAQTGCPHGTGTGGSGKKLKAEFNKEPHKRGTVSMARAQNPDSGDSQFFICFADAPFLNGQYTVWGKVTEGMENVDKIKRGEPVTDPDRIVSARWATRSSSLEFACYCLMSSPRRRGPIRRVQARWRDRRKLSDGCDLIMGRRLRGDDSGGKATRVAPARALRRLGFAHPGFLGEPFVLGPADRAIDAREEHRRGLEARAVGNDAGGDVASGVRAFDHDGAHGHLPIPKMSLAEPYRCGVDMDLTSRGDIATSR